MEGWRGGGMEGWRGGGMEGWRGGGVEGGGWRDGGMEGWRDGGVEGRRGGGVEGWRGGGMEGWKIEEGKGEVSTGEGGEVGEEVGRKKERRKVSILHTNCALQVNASLIHKPLCMKD